MLRRGVLVTLSLFFLFRWTAFGASNKALMHYLSVPVVEGAGVYACVMSLRDNNAGVHTMAASYTNLGLIATEGALGLITVFLDGERRHTMRTVHRVMGFALTAAALWLGFANSLDKTGPVPQSAAYSYAALTSVPLVMFTF